MTALEKRLKREIREADLSYEQHIANKRRARIWAAKWEAAFGQRPASADGIRRLK